MLQQYMRVSLFLTKPIVRKKILIVTTTTYRTEPNQTKPIISSERDCYLSWPAMTFLCKRNMANTFVVMISLKMRNETLFTCKQDRDSQFSLHGNFQNHHTLITTMFCSTDTWRYGNVSHAPPQLSRSEDR